MFVAAVVVAVVAVVVVPVVVVVVPVDSRFRFVFSSIGHMHF